MKQLALIAVPLLAAALALVWPNQRSRSWLLPGAGLLHVALAFWLMAAPPPLAATAWFGFDPVARAVLPMVSLLFLACSAYGVAYLKLHVERGSRVFIAALLVLLGMLSLALQAQQLGLLWVAAEAATLVTVPLLHFNGTAPRSRPRGNTCSSAGRASRCPCSAPSAWAMRLSTAAGAAT